MLLNEHRIRSSQASARIRRWSLFLFEYEYTLKFRDTTAHANADALSRLPLPVTTGMSILPPELILLTKQLEDLPITPCTHLVSQGSHHIQSHSLRQQGLAQEPSSKSQALPIKEE